jgi:Tfp pilus assembly protein PilV
MGGAGRWPAAVAGFGRRLAARARGERGTTLVEVLVAATLGVIVLGATLEPLVTTQRAEQRATAWQDQLAQAEVQTARMMHEIRQAYSVVAASPNSIDFLISLAGASVQVSYRCDVAQPGTAYRECVRLQAAVGAALPAVSSGAPVVTGLLDGSPADPVFGFSPNALDPTYVTSHLEFPAAGGSAYGLTHPIVIDDGAYLRNTAVST